jgi:YaiO family outer membrane protein
MKLSIKKNYFFIIVFWSLFISFPAMPQSVYYDYQHYWLQKYFEKKKYIRSAYLDKKLLKKNPQDTYAKEQLELIEEINPYLTKGLNEVGIFSENLYVSDKKAVWDFTNAFVRRDTAWGSFLGSMNFANRLGKSAVQGQVTLSPVINQKVYFDLLGAYANNPVLFPNYVAGGEGYLNNTLPADFSLGMYYQSILPQIAFMKYTGSISKELKRIWYIFRPIYFRPLHGKPSTLFTFKGIKYFDTYDNFVSITLGLGHSPDLANFETINFLVVSNKFIMGNYQFPIFNHAMTVNIGAAANQWIFFNDRIRNLIGGNIGINYRF